MVNRAIVQDFKKKWDRQSQAFYNLFRQADRVEKLAQTIERLVRIMYLRRFLHAPLVILISAYTITGAR